MGNTSHLTWKIVHSFMALLWGVCLTVSSFPYVTLFNILYFPRVSDIQVIKAPQRAFYKELE